MPPSPIPGDIRASEELPKVTQDGSRGAELPKASNTMLHQPKRSSLDP